MESLLHLPYASHGTPSCNKEIVKRGFHNEFGEKGIFEKLAFMSVETLVHDASMQMLV